MLSVLNLYMVKGFPPYPMRSCEKIAGPFFCLFSNTYIKTNIGDSTTSTIRAAVKSISRFITSCMLFMASYELTVIPFSFIFMLLLFTSCCAVILLLINTKNEVCCKDNKNIYIDYD